MSLEITLPFKFNARPYQIPIFQAREKGFDRIVQVWSRRSGKDLTDLNLTIREMANRKGDYYYFYPEYAQAKKAIWQGRDKDGVPFLDHFPKQLISKKNDSDMRIELKLGSAFQLVGTDNYNSIMSCNPVGCVFSEFSLQDPFAWQYIRPILTENKGWAVFNGTPRGENHLKDILNVAQDNPKKWFNSVLTVDDLRDEKGNRFISEEDIERERREGMSEEMIQQEFYVSFNATQVGAYYSKQITEMIEKKRIGSVPWNELQPVFTFWDLGMDDTMFVIFVQQDGYSYQIIDCVYDHGKGFDHYVKAIYDRPYRYGKHFVPHDAKVREMGTGRERSKTLDALLREEVVVLPRPKCKEDKIEATRWLLKKVYVDNDNCRYLLNGLKSYRQKYDDKLKTWSNEPLHDWSSHPADCVAYLGLYVRSGETLQENYKNFQTLNSQVETNYEQEDGGLII